MTLILSAVFGDYAVQVSDRRFSYFNNVRPPDDNKNKAVIFYNQLIFAYTGLGYINGLRCDDWLTQTLVNADSDFVDAPEPNPEYDSISYLRTQATKAFNERDLKYCNKQLKRHAFIGVGWGTNAAGQTKPVIISVSNAHTEQFKWLPEAQNEFTYRWLTPTSAEEFPPEIIASGQEIPNEDLIRLKRNITNSHQKGNSPEPIIRLMSEEIRKVAKKQKTVGEDLMIVCLPRKANQSNEVMVLTDMAPIAKYSMKNCISSYFLSASGEIGSQFMPNTVISRGCGLKNIEIERLNKSGTDKHMKFQQVLPKKI